MVWLHNLDPFAVQFTQNVGLRWYGLAYLVGLVAGYFIIQFLAKRSRLQIKPKQV